MQPLAVDVRSTRIDEVQRELVAAHWIVTGAARRWGRSASKRAWLNRLCLNIWPSTTLRRSFARAGELKGDAIVPPTDIPNVGRFSVLRDPQGAVFAVFRPAPGW